MYEVYTYGGLDVLVLLFNGITAIMGEDAFGTLIRLIGVLGLLVVLFQATFTQKFHLPFTYFLFFILIYLALFVPKASIAITDRHQPLRPPEVIANVPLGLAFFASTASVVGDALTRRFEAVFALPGDLRYETNGVVFGSKLLDRISRAAPVDSVFEDNLMRYFGDCVFYDVFNGRYTWDDLLHADDLWAFVTTNGGTTGATTLVVAGGGTTIQTCPDANTVLATDWTVEYDRLTQEIGSELYIDNPATASLRLRNAMPQAASYYMTLGNTAEQILKQYVMMNTMGKAATRSSALAGANAKLLEFGIGQAELQRNNAYVGVSALFAHTLPMIRTALEAVLYGIFPVVFLVMLLPGGARILAAYTKGIVWVQLWPIMFAIVNLIFSVYASAVTPNYAFDAQTGAIMINAATAGGITSFHATMAIIAGYVMVSVPVMAWYVVSGGQFAISQLASTLSQPAMSSAQAASGGLTTGNFNVNTTSSNMHNANKLDSNHSLRYGVTTVQGPDGIATTTGIGGHGDPYHVDDMSARIDRVPISANVNDAWKQTLSNHQQVAQDLVERRAKAASTTRGTYFQEMRNVGMQLGISDGTTDGSGRVHSGGHSAEFQEAQDLVRSFERSHGMQHGEGFLLLTAAGAGGRGSIDAAGILGKFITRGKGGGKGKGGGGDLPVSVEISGDGRVSVNGNEDDRLTDLWRDAQRFARSDRFNETVRSGLMSEISYRSQHGESVDVSDGERLSAAYNRMTEARQEHALAFTELESFRRATGEEGSLGHDFQQTIVPAFMKFLRKNPRYSQLTREALLDPQNRGDLLEAMDAFYNEQYGDLSAGAPHFTPSDPGAAWARQREDYAFRTVEDPEATPEGAFHDYRQQLDGVAQEYGISPEAIDNIMARSRARLKANRNRVNDAGLETLERRGEVEDPGEVLKQEIAKAQGRGAIHIRAGRVEAVAKALKKLLPDNPFLSITAAGASVMRDATDIDPRDPRGGAPATPTGPVVTGNPLTPGD